MIIAARLQQRTSERRSGQRRKLHLETKLHASGDEVTVHDISPTGMLIQTRAELVTFDAIDVELPEVGAVQAFVIWNSGEYYGCEFERSIPKATISAAILRSRPTPVRSGALPEKSVVGSAWPPSISPHHETFDSENIGDDPLSDRAPLGVRLRVIIGSAILLWAVLIWGMTLAFRRGLPTWG